MVSCSNDDLIDDKEFVAFLGVFLGNSINSANSADVTPMSITVTSEGNPVAGTYKLGSSTGKISGSVLGLILDLTLKPDSGGTVYKFSGNIGDNNSTVSGTMTGVEGGKATTYNVNLKK